MLNEKLSIIAQKCVNDKVDVKTALIFFQLTKMFNIPANSALSYARPYFALLARTDNFLEVEFELALKVSLQFKAERIFGAGSAQRGKQVAYSEVQRIVRKRCSAKCSPFFAVSPFIVASFNRQIIFP